VIATKGNMMTTPIATPRASWSSREGTNASQSIIA
jgi:hypothetical protein